MRNTKLAKSISMIIASGLVGIPLASLANDGVIELAQAKPAAAQVESSKKSTSSSKEAKSGKKKRPAKKPIAPPSPPPPPPAVVAPVPEVVPPTSYDYEEPTFRVSGFTVEGPELIPRDQVMDVLKAFADRDVTLFELRTATNAVEQLHTDKGYDVVRVIIPEQEIEPGQNLKIVIVDARLDVVTVAGNNFFKAEHIQSALSVLQPGALINTNDMDKTLRLMNDNPSNTVRVKLEPSDKPKLVDAKIQVQDRDPLGVFLTADNTGTNATGDFRMGLSIQHNNLFDRGHMGSLNAISSPGRWSDVTVYALGYKVPFYEYDSMFEFNAADSNVNAGSFSIGASSVGVQGAGFSYGFKWTYLLDRWDAIDQRISVSQDFKKFISDVRLAGTTTSLVPNTESRPTTITYSATEAEDSRTRSLNVSYVKNYVSGGDNSTAQYQRTNASAVANFDYWKMSATWSDQIFGPWRYALGFDAQYSGNSLISGEQFGAGGIYSVRGFEERVIGADSGMRQSIEFTGPNYSKDVSEYLERLQPAFFAEAAQLRSNSAGAGAASEPYIASFGAGLRFAFTPKQQIRLDLARVVSGLPVQPHGDVMLHFTFATSLY